MHLIQNRHSDAGQFLGIGVEHVAEHLGGHHDDRSPASDGVVPGQKADVLPPVLVAEVLVLLVGKGLDGGGVKGPQPLGQGQVDRHLGHQGLACSGGSGHDDVEAFFQRLGRFGLEGVGFEWQGFQELAADRRRAHFLSTNRTSQ